MPKLLGKVFLEIILSQFSDFHQRAQQPGFQWAIPVNWNNDALPATGHRENMMAAMDSSQNPTTLLNNPRKLATGDLLHTATSMI
jgi:hypothetical protein